MYYDGLQEPQGLSPAPWLLCVGCLQQNWPVQDLTGLCMLRACSQHLIWLLVACRQSTEVLVASFNPSTGDIWAPCIWLGCSSHARAACPSGDASLTSPATFTFPWSRSRVPRADPAKAGGDLTHFIRSNNSTKLEAVLLEGFGSFHLHFSGNLLPR